MAKNMVEKIFLFGQTSSGKSTVAASICKFLFDTPGITPILNTKNRTGGLYLYDEWVTKLRLKEFPPKTPTNEIIRVDVGADDRRNSRSVDFTFFEIAGERVKEMNPFYTDEDTLQKDPTKVIEIVEVENKLKEASIILLIGSSCPEEKECFNIFMFLHRLRDIKMDLPIAFVISKWDLVNTQFTNPIDFATIHYCEVLKTLANDFPKAPVFSFSVGNVRGTNQNKEIVNGVDFSQGTTNIFNWITQQQNTRKSGLRFFI